MHLGCATPTAQSLPLLTPGHDASLLRPVEWAMRFRSCLSAALLLGLAPTLTTVPAQGAPPALVDKVVAVIDTKFIARSDVVVRAKPLVMAVQKNGEKPDKER